MASRFHLFGVVLARSFFPSFRLWFPKAVQRSASCRSRRELSNAYFLATFAFDAAEHEPCKVWPIAAPRLLRGLLRPRALLLDIREAYRPAAVPEAGIRRQNSAVRWRTVLAGRKIVDLKNFSGMKEKRSSLTARWGAEGQRPGWFSPAQC